MSEVNNVNDTSRDETIDLSSLIKPKVEEPIIEETSTAATQVQESPLERALRQQQEEPNGIIIDNKPKEALKENKEIDQGLENIDKHIQEMDKQISKAEKVEVVNKPKNEFEMVELMNELDAVDEDGNVPEGAKFIKAIGDHPNLSEDIRDHELEKAPTVEELPEEKRAIVELFIDKTGYGVDVILTPEEREKVRLASEIRVTEVEEVSLASFTVLRDEPTFLDEINEYEIFSAKHNVIFPISGFKGAVKGLSFGEMGDISGDGQFLDVDKLRKQISVVYNKLTDLSIPQFASFNDFLDNFAYMDLNYALNALVVATFPEVDEVSLICNNGRCRQTFYHKFAPRTLLQLTDASEKILDNTAKVLNSRDLSGKEVYDNSVLKNRKYYRLSDSIIVEIGFASCREYLEMILSNVLDKDYSEKFGNDINNIKRINSTLLGAIRGFIVTRKDGKQVKFTTHDNMVELMYRLNDNAYRLLIQIITKHMEAYNVKFAVTDVVCPHCGTKTPRVSIDVGNLLFYKNQKDLSTTLNIDNITLL